MAFINTIPVDDASGETEEMYRRQQQNPGYVPGYAKIFSHRPEVMDAWATLLKTVKAPVSHRNFELATLAAAIELKSTNCSLAHAGFLGRHFSDAEILLIVSGLAVEQGVITKAEQVLYKFAGLIAADASAVSASDVQELKAEGFSDEEVFDIAAIAAARAFFTKLVDGLGSKPDVSFDHLDEELRQRLIVGRPVDLEVREAICS